MVVVEREPLDLAVVLAGEERAGAFVGEELPGDAVEGADVDRGHAVDETGADGGEEARRVPRPADSASPAFSSCVVIPSSMKDNGRSAPAP